MWWLGTDEKPKNKREKEDVEMMNLQLLNKERAMEVNYFVGGVNAKINEYRECIEFYVTGKKEYSEVQFLVATVFNIDGKPVISARSKDGKQKEYKTLRGLVNFLGKEFGTCLEMGAVQRMFKIELEKAIEIAKEKREMENNIKERTTVADVLREEILKESESKFSLQGFDENKGCGDVIYNNKTTIWFSMDENFEITVTGGDTIAYGEWYDLELDDEYLISCANKLQEVLYRIKNKNLVLSHQGVHRVYPNEAEVIIEERKIKGKFYLREINKWVGIDNETGDAWTVEFDTLEACINWLLNINQYECSYCDNDGDYTVNIYIEFKDGSDYSELIGSYEEKDIVPYIKELIEEKGWENEVSEYTYGYYCPYCLESLD